MTANGPTVNLECAKCAVWWSQEPERFPECPKCGGPVSDNGTRRDNECWECGTPNDDHPEGYCPDPCPCGSTNHYDGHQQNESTR